MGFCIAFDKDENKEFMLYDKMVTKNNGIIYANSSNKLHVGNIGTFLLMFLNTDFTNIDSCRAFILDFYFKPLFKSKYSWMNDLYLHRPLDEIMFYIPKEDFLKELLYIAKEEQDYLIYAKNVLLKGLLLPYDASIDEDEDPEENMKLSEKHMKNADILLEDYDEKIELQEQKKEKLKKEQPEEFKQPLKEMKQREEKNFDTNFGKLGDDINCLIEELSIEFTLVAYVLSNVNIYNYNVPYCFQSSNIVSILGISLKEFKTRKI